MWRLNATSVKSPQEVLSHVLALGPLSPSRTPLA